jgi:hypothetical protein
MNETSSRLTELTERLEKHIADNRPESEALAPSSVWNLSQTVQHCAQTIDYSRWEPRSTGLRHWIPNYP